MSSFQYSDRYTSDDDKYEYRLVTIPRNREKITRVMTEAEWKVLGVQQSPGWENYAIYPPDNVMLFRRLKPAK